jgi:hypothetical protein
MYVCGHALDTWRNSWRKQEPENDRCIYNYNAIISIRLVRFLTEEENRIFIVLYVNAQLAFSLKIKKIFPVSGQKY